MNDFDFFSGGKYIYFPFLKSKKAALPSDDRETLNLAQNLYSPFSLKGRLLKKIKCNFYCFFGKKVEKGALISELENRLKVEFITAVYWATDKNKIVVQLINKDTRTIYGYLKISNSKLGDNLIKNEINALEHLKSEVAPKLIVSGYWKHSPYFIMEHVDGKALNSELDGHVLGSILSKLSLSNKRTKLKDHQRFKGIIQSLKTIKGYDFDGIALKNIYVSSSIEHGDFAPWNILTNEKSCTRLIDFEMYTFNGIEGLDLIKYYFQHGHLVKKYDGLLLIEYLGNRIKNKDFYTLLLVFLMKEICNKHTECEDFTHDVYILELLKDME